MNQHGLILAALGDLKGARRSFEDALAQDQDNLEYGLNLGRALTELGAFEEALQLLDDQVARWPDGAQRQLALLALGEAQLGAGQASSALEAASEVVRTCAAGAADEAAQLLLVRALALSAEARVAQDQAPGFLEPPAPKVNDALVEQLAAATIHRARRATATRALTLLTALRALLIERLGESHGATIRTLAGIANTHRELNNHPQRREALDALVASLRVPGRGPAGDRHLADPRARRARGRRRGR